MESSNVFNTAVRVKNEPLDDNDYKIIDTIPTQEHLQEYDENHKNELDDLEIEMECTDMKPNLLLVAKIEDHSPNQWQDNDVCKNRSKIKLETVGTVKKEVFGKEETDLNFRRGLSEQNKRGTVSKELNYENRLKTHNDTRHNKITHDCDICGKSFKYKNYLQRHIASVHRKIRQTCDIYHKIFPQKTNLKIHIDSVHNVVRHACDICRKTFTRKNHLKTHVDSVHHKITHPCDECQKTFSDKGYLKKHIASKRNLRAHIDAAHRSRNVTQ
uniref:C2H2-type domain-containing protein n=1 Tax=Trichogramma kaykai TaxID=54128 RepID=A0ABD2XK51_9HYME